MANIKSAIKDIRQTRTRTARNVGVRSELKTLLKKFNIAKTGEDAAEKTATARALISALDKAAKRSVVHANLVARHKARCAQYL